MIALMARPLILYVILLLLIVVSLGVGYIASDWPHWCSAHHWCDTDWPRLH
jgi:hypothetical protein